MAFNRPQAKLEAKQLMKNSKGQIYRQTAMFLFISLLISQLFLMLTGFTEFMERTNTDLENDLALLEEQYDLDDPMFDVDDYMDDSIDIFLGYYPKVSPVSIFIAFLLIIMSNVFSAGYEWWCLLNSRKQPCDFRNMFDGFGFTFRLLCHLFIRSFLISIGTLFFIIPGIILQLMYSQSIYILFEDQSNGIIGSLRKSRKMMSGNLGDYFVMQLSFFGWAYLGALITQMIAMVFNAIGLAMISALSSIFFDTWLTPYMGLTRASFYNYLTGYTASTELSPKQPIEEDNTL